MMMLTSWLWTLKGTNNKKQANDKDDADKLVVDAEGHYDERK